ncbi:uncharacterized protein EDB93DRAFT_1180158 [Suillus bovinus]|uniref:uncharacterized protein n=1 Tax=Suillus bovinus TaxID=48563 RepID=UPI001B85B89B|nr:uncharacterized protein EDB93DRAFT_1180158 [Suillus bovinus]KAG2130409.1 hypothetical protein EDB93DRAFT_1180158 [Suillus bovinus]
MPPGSVPISAKHFLIRQLCVLKCHICLLAASAVVICLAIPSFHHLETILLDRIMAYGRIPALLSDLVMLESMTLPLALPFFLDDDWQELNSMFAVLHLPMLRKFTLVGAPETPQVDCLSAMLAVASFREPLTHR